MPNGAFGTSEAANKLADIIPLTVQAIEENLRKLESQSQAVKDSWEARDNNQIDEMVDTIDKAVKKSMENVEQVEKSIRAYAEFLAAHGM